MIFLSIISYSKINIEGIDYLSSKEIKTMGFKVDNNFIVFKNQRFKVDYNYVESKGAKIDFTNVIFKKENVCYYNSFFIEELKKTDFKNQNKLKNIISLSPGITEKIYDLKMEDNLVGRTTFCKYPEEVLKIDTMGSLMEPKLEKVLSKNPDIVLMETHYNKNFVNKLEDLGIEYNLYHTPNNLKDMYDEYREIGVSIGVPERGAIVAASLKSQIESYNYLNRNLEKKPKVYFVVGTGRGEYTAGKDTFINDLITHSGGINIARNKKGWKYSLEEIIMNDPDYIIGGKNNIDIIKKHPNYSRLSALIKGNVYVVEEHIFVLPGSRGVKEGIPKLMNIFNSKIQK
jgi:iron complex transport system substrate-binding protein